MPNIQIETILVLALIVIFLLWLGITIWGSKPSDRDNLRADLREHGRQERKFEKIRKQMFD